MLLIIILNLTKLKYCILLNGIKFHYLHITELESTPVKTPCDENYRMKNGMRKGCSQEMSNNIAIMRGIHSEDRNV